MFKNIKIFLSSKKSIILLYLLNTILLISFYNLYQDQRQILLYPFILSFFVLFIYLILSYGHFLRLKEALDDYVYDGKNNAFTMTPYEKIFMDKFDEMKDLLEEKNSKLNNEFVEEKRFISQWIHNMKNKINILRFLADHEPSIKVEIDKLSNLLDMALNYLRAHEFYNDFIIEPLNLQMEVKNILNQMKENFIYGSCFPKITCRVKDGIIYSDRKWHNFVLEQILLNSIKYSKRKPTSLIECIIDENEFGYDLIIKDQGIGINAFDLNKVFQAFFTGENGRHEKNASGIGLYISKKVLDHLNHSISIESKENVGTEVKLTYITRM